MRLTQISESRFDKFGRLAFWSDLKQGWVLVSDLMRFDDDSDASYICLSEVLDWTAFQKMFANSQPEDEYVDEEEDEDGVFSANNERFLTLSLLQQKIDEFERSGDGDVAVYRPGVDSSRYAQLFSSTEKILCIGLNYADHAKEFGDPLPEEPVIFNKAPSALNFCGEGIVIPSVSKRVDYEGELVVVIGQEGRDIPEDCAMDYVAGYCCGNDVSARDWQKDKPAGQWFLGKSFDTFAVVGPCFVTSDEVGDPNNLKIETRLNGQTMQSSNTDRFIFRIERLISYLSQVMTLKVGDLIFTGTPNGVGDARRPPVYLKRGDEIVVEIEKVGVLTNPIE